MANSGWRYVGDSAETGKPLYVAPIDAGIMNWYEATEAAKAIGARLPLPGELNQIFNQAGGFNKTGSGDSCYWTSSSLSNDEGCAKFQSFTKKKQQNAVPKDCVMSVRFVRD